MSDLGGVLDLQRSTISIRGRPPYQVPKTKTGLMIIPVTKSAVERWRLKMSIDETSFATVDAQVEIDGRPYLPDLEGLPPRQRSVKPSSIVLSPLTKNIGTF